jgi:pimeloyl-ACP methyl ester carboxylesterase
MKQFLLSFFMVFLILTSCQREKITLGTDVYDTFYVENAGASMHVLVAGNTAVKTFIVFVHGGPGISSLFYRTDYIRKNIEDKYAIVYWDQRNAGDRKSVV